MSTNPFESPKSHLEFTPEFHPDRLPIEFRLTRNGFATWGLMLVLDLFVLIIQYISFGNTDDVAFSMLTLAWFSVHLVSLYIAVWALGHKIVISKSGIMFHGFRSETPWGEIASWTQAPTSMITIELTNGRRFRVIGPATSAPRNQVILDALHHFCLRPEKSLGVGLNGLAGTNEQN